MAADEDVLTMAGCCQTSASAPGSDSAALSNRRNRAQETRLDAHGRRDQAQQPVGSGRDVLTMDGASAAERRGTFPGDQVAAFLLLAREPLPRTARGLPRGCRFPAVAGQAAASSGRKRHRSVPGSPVAQDQHQRPRRGQLVGLPALSAAGDHGFAQAIDHPGHLERMPGIQPLQAMTNEVLVGPVGDQPLAAIDDHLHGLSPAAMAAAG